MSYHATEDIGPTEIGIPCGPRLPTVVGGTGDERARMFAVNPSISTHLVAVLRHEFNSLVCDLVQILDGEVGDGRPVPEEQHQPFVVE